MMDELNEDDPFPVAKLIPVSEWVWHLWKVTYHRGENGPVEHIRYTVCTETHVEGEVCDGDDWPSRELTHVKWEPVADNVKAPRPVGSFYGRPISESGWEAGKREAQSRGLLQ